MKPRNYLIFAIAIAAILGHLPVQANWMKHVLKALPRGAKTAIPEPVNTNKEGIKSAGDGIIRGTDAERTIEHKFYYIHQYVGSYCSLIRGGPTGDYRQAEAEFEDYIYKTWNSYKKLMNEDAYLFPKIDRWLNSDAAERVQTDALEISLKYGCWMNKDQNWEPYLKKSIKSES